MVEAVLRSRRRRAVERMAVAAERYAAMGWPVCAGTYPPGRMQRPGEAQRSCSCDRLGCPAPGAHPVSPAWQIQATADPVLVGRWWLASPEANVVLVTGRVFDVLDVPASAGIMALARMDRSGVRPGPVALSAGSRALFFVTTRGRPADEDEWWSCHLDSEPEPVARVAGLRWHCRDSYVLAPPSRFAGGLTSRWLRAPAAMPAAAPAGDSAGDPSAPPASAGLVADPAGEPPCEPLPDGLLLLEFLADACEAIG